MSPPRDLVCRVGGAATGVKLGRDGTRCVGAGGDSGSDFHGGIVGAVSDQRLQFFGRWKDIATANDRYVDAACTDTYGCYRLFGHLLPAADRLQSVARSPRDMAQW